MPAALQAWYGEGERKLMSHHSLQQPVNTGLPMVKHFPHSLVIYHALACGYQYDILSHLFIVFFCFLRRGKRMRKM